MPVLGFYAGSKFPHLSILRVTKLPMMWRYGISNFVAPRGSCGNRARTVHLFGYRLFPRSTMPESELLWLLLGLLVHYHSPGTCDKQGLQGAEIGTLGVVLWGPFNRVKVG